MTAMVVVCANMKGGVGKTTVAVSLAEGSAQLGKRTLVIDLDLQLNASMTLVSDRDGDEPWKRDRTIEDYLRARSRGDELRGMALLEQIDSNLHLLSGRLSLVLFERELLTQNTAVFTAANHVGKWLNDLLVELRAYFELIVLDTPPGLSLLAECAIREADLIVVPQAPDRLSTQGIEVYATYLTRHLGMRDVGQKTVVLINMVPNPLTKVARSTIKRIREMAGNVEFPYRLFGTQYPIRTSFREAMSIDRPTDFEKLWTDATDHVVAASRELWTFLDRPLENEARDASARKSTVGGAAQQLDR